MKVLKNKLFIFFSSIVVLVLIFLILMPKAIDMDLEKIGNGQNSVVFIYDPNLAVSNKQTIEINNAREVLGETVNFLVARAGDPQSASFRNRHNAASAELLFFNADGALIDRRGALFTSSQFIEFFSGN